MFWKDQLAADILSQHQINVRWVLEQQKVYPQIRVKTIDAKGSVPVIQLSEKGEWYKPSEWANNHVAHLTQTYRELQQRLVDCGSDPASLCKADCSVVAELNERPSCDPREISSLKAKYKSLKDAFVYFYNETGFWFNGDKPTLNFRKYYLQVKQDWDSGRLLSPPPDVD